MLEVSPAKATALVLRDEYEEQIDVTDTDEVIAHRDRALELPAWRGALSAVQVFKRSNISEYRTSARGEDLATLYCCERPSARYGEELVNEDGAEMTIPVAMPPDDDLAPLPGLIQLKSVMPKAGWITLLRRVDGPPRRTHGQDRLGECSRERSLRRTEVRAAREAGSRSHCAVRQCREYPVSPDGTRGSDREADFKNRRRRRRSGLSVPPEHSREETRWALQRRPSRITGERLDSSFKGFCRSECCEDVLWASSGTPVTPSDLQAFRAVVPLAETNS